MLKFLEYLTLPDIMILVLFLIVLVAVSYAAGKVRERIQRRDY